MWQDFERKHSAELALYEAAVRYLEKLKANGEEVTPKKWQAEADRLKAEKSVQCQKMKAMREDIKAVENLKKTAEQLVRTETEPPERRRNRNYDTAVYHHDNHHHRKDTRAAQAASAYGGESAGTGFSFQGRASAFVPL